MKNITINIEDLLNCGIKPEDTLKILKYAYSDNNQEIRSALYRYFGELTLNKHDLDTKGISQESVKIGRYIYLVLNCMSKN